MRKSGKKSECLQGAQFREFLKAREQGRSLGGELLKAEGFVCSKSFRTGGHGNDQAVR